MIFNICASAGTQVEIDIWDIVCRTVGRILIKQPWFQAIIFSPIFWIIFIALLIACAIAAWLRDRKPRAVSQPSVNSRSEAKKMIEDYNANREEQMNEFKAEHRDIPHSATAGDWESIGKSVSPVASQLRHTFTSAGRHGTEFVSRFKQINFKKEIWPLDAASAQTLAAKPAFWAIMLLAALPLFFTTLTQLNYELVAFAMYFAVIWGLIFRFSVVPGAKISWGLLASAMLFTAFFGGFVLIHIIDAVMPNWFLNMPDSQNAFARLIGLVGQTGVSEELCKIVPVVMLLAIFRRRLSYGDIVMLGIFSGLGFAAIENLQYFNLRPDSYFNSLLPGAIDAATNDPNSGAAAIHQAVVVTSQTSILMALSRSMSCTFGHAVYSGVFAHFLAQGRGAGIKQVPLWLVGLAMAAVLHGTYDWLGTIQDVLPVLATVTSFMLLKLYIAQGSETNLLPTSPTVPQVDTVATGEPIAV